MGRVLHDALYDTFSGLLRPETIEALIVKTEELGETGSIAFRQMLDAARATGIEIKGLADRFLQNPELVGRLGFLFTVGVGYGGLLDASRVRMREAALQGQLGAAGVMA